MGNDEWEAACGGVLGHKGEKNEEVRYTHRKGKRGCARQEGKEAGE